MKNARSVLLALSVSTILGCDYVKVPLGDDGVTSPPPTNTFRNVLVEDFTGQECGNCPSAAHKISQLEDVYHDQMIPVGIHAGWQASYGNPHLPNLSCEDAEDFITSYDVDIAGKPGLMVNRQECDGDLLIGFGGLPSCVESQKELLRVIELTGTASFDAGNSEISITVNTKALTPLDGDHQIVVYLMEDHVIAPQKIYSHADHPQASPAGDVTISDFDHRHVLRDIVTASFGDNLITGAAESAEEFPWQDNYNFDGANWNIDNSYFVVFVINASTEEILDVSTIGIDQ